LGARLDFHDADSTGPFNLHRGSRAMTATAEATNQGFFRLTVRGLVA
jgi:hypothetical protein